VDYSPLAVESDAEVLVKEERRPEATLAAVLPPIFLRRRNVASLFWCLISVPHKTKYPKIYIDGFRSK
jgi:hypothetical protein